MTAQQSDPYFDYFESHQFQEPSQVEKKEMAQDIESLIRVTSDPRFDARERERTSEHMQELAELRAARLERERLEREQQQRMVIAEQVKSKSRAEQAETSSAAVASTLSVIMDEAHSEDIPVLTERVDPADSVTKPSEEVAPQTFPQLHLAANNPAQPIAANASRESAAPRKVGASLKQIFQVTSALIRLKRLDVPSIAAAISMPLDSVKRALAGDHSALRPSMWAKMLSIAGLAGNSRLNNTSPHFLHFDGSVQCIADAKAVKELFSNTRVAVMRFNEGVSIKRLFNKSPRVLVLQNDHLRAVFIEHSRFSITGSIPESSWAVKTEKQSQVLATLPISKFLSGDIDNREFDALFNRKGRIDWSQVEVLARANRVDIDEILDFILKAGDKIEGLDERRLHAVEEDASFVFRKMAGAR